MRFVVAQLGARLHYAVPRVLSCAGALECLYTDLCMPRIAGSLVSVCGSLVPRSLRRCFGRVPGEIPRHKVVSFPAMAIEYYWRRTQGEARRHATAAHIWAGGEFCKRVIQYGLGSAGGVYTLNSAALELLQHARAQGLFGVMEQTSAPSAIEDALLQTEELEYPGWDWSRIRDEYRREFQYRERMEWETADLILCGSGFVRDGVRTCAGPVDRCLVVPYGVVLSPAQRVRTLSRRKLHVLTVGAVGLTKGSPYVVAAARRLQHLAEFRMVGRLPVTEKIRREISEYLCMTGPVPRTSVQEHFSWADLFLLPSICEGSATVCYEALAAGLPVITTPNAGSVIRNGLEGFIVPVRSWEAIAEKLELLARDGDLLAWMSANAVERSQEFSLEKYGERLVTAIKQAYSNHPAESTAAGH